MGILRHLQHWLSGQGPHLQTTEFVPETHPIRLWADTFPWDTRVDAVTQSFAQRFPKTRPKGGRAPVSPRVLLALELLKHELGESDEDVCQRLRTDVAVMYACGLREVQADRSQVHFVLPETLAQFRRRIDQDLMDQLVAIQGAAAMEEGLVSPAHLLVDTFPSEQGSQRVTDATTLYKAQKNLQVIVKIARQCGARTPQLTSPAEELQGHLQKVMRGFGRQCRGQGKVFVKLVCQTERQLLELGHPIEG